MNVDPHAAEEPVAAPASAAAVEDPNEPVATSGRRVLWGGAVAALVLLLGNLALAWLNHDEKVDDDRAATATLKVGESLTRLLSWKSTTVVDELDDELQLLTGDFASKYEDLVRTTIGPSAEKGKLDSTAEIVGEGVIGVDGDRIELLFFVNVTVSKVTAKATEQPNKVGSRIKVTAVERDGTWLIEKYDPI